MTKNFEIIGAMMLGCGVVASMASCAHPVERTMQARLNERLLQMETSGKIATGASDDVGLFIARDTSLNALTLKPTMPTGIFLANR